MAEIDTLDAMPPLNHYYEDIPELGNVALSRHAQVRAVRDGISEAMILDVLLQGRDTPDGDSIWRELKGIRLVIITPDPFRGAQLVTTMYRVKPPARSR